MKNKIIVMCLLLVTLIMSSCAYTESEDNSKINIVTTTTMLDDLASVIGGDLVNSTSLMGAGIDPHLYQASAGDVHKMSEADIVIYNGLDLEGKMGDVFATLTEQDKNVISVEEAVDKTMLIQDPSNPSTYDPHVWYDVRLWKIVAENTANKLAEYDSKNAEIYMQNLEDYLAELDSLEEYISDKIDLIPTEMRTLITAHDAFGYFGRAYQFEVYGIQGFNTDTEAGTADMSILADYIIENEVKAIFVESSVPTKGIEALRDAVSAGGFAVEIGGNLYSDALGDKASGHDTYIKTYTSNIDTIVDALK